MINALSCPDHLTLIQALNIINKNAKGIVFVVNKTGKLCGVLTDGDIRRQLIKNGDLGISVDEIMNRNFVSALYSETKGNMLKKISDKVKIIPLVDEDFRLVDFFEYKADIHIPVATPDLTGNEFKYLMDAFISTWISSSGEYISRFENEFSKYCDTRYGVAVSNGTVSIQLALNVLGVGEGDEVIVPDLTFASPVNAVIHSCARPVIVDIEKDSWCISPDAIKKAITKKTKAIIVVHLYGQPANMEDICQIARDNNLFIIEDCAEAHGATFKKNKVGSFGDISCFSFFANKVITTGEGGMCVTQNEEYYYKLKLLRDHGMSPTKKYWHDVVGFNYRLTNLQAAIGVAQLERISDILYFRRKIENQYRSVLGNDIISFQENIDQTSRITWLVCGLVNNRDKVIDELKKLKIDVRPFFYSLSDMDIYKSYSASSAVSKQISGSGISFPTNSLVQEEVLKQIKEIINKNS